MNELKIIIRAVTTEAQKNMADVRKELQGISKEAKDTSDKFGAAMKGIARATAIVITTITAVVTAIVALGKSTLEFQKQAGQLNAAFAAMGKSAQTAASVYQGFYRFLGETDTAIEASNLLVKLTQDEANLAEWTKILQGVYATFPDSLPIESLVESANETARVGTVTGNLADALNWAGESEDAFNEKLAQTTSLSEREALIRNTLNGLYGRAAEIYENNNKALLDYNESQANLQSKTAELGATITPLLTYLNNLGAVLVSAVKPAFETVIPYIAAFVLWLTEAVSRAASFFGIMSGSSKSVQQVGEKTSKVLNQAKTGTNGVVNGLNNIKKSAEAAKRAAMGFDELNVVPSGKSGGGAGVAADTSGLGAGLGEGFDMSGTLMDMEDFNKKVQQIKGDIDAWMEDWGWALETIGAVLAALSIRSLIIQFANLVGLGDKVAKILSFSGLVGGIKSLVGWLGAFIGLMKEGNSFWAVFGAAFPKLTAAFKAVGTAIAAAAKAVAAFVGGLSAGAIAAIIAIVAAIASAVYFLWENWDGVVQAVKNFFAENIAPKLETIGKAFGDIWEAVKSLGKAFADLGKLIWDALPDGVKEWLASVGAAIRDVIKAIVEWFASGEWLKALGTVFEWLGGLIVGILGGVIGGAFNALMSIIQGVVNFIAGAVELVAGIVGGLVNLIVALFTGDFSKALDSVKMIWDGIVKVFKAAYDLTIGVVVEFVEGIIDWFVEMWDVLVGHSIVPDTIEAIIKWFLELPLRAVKIVADFTKDVIGWFGDMFTKAYDATLKAFGNAKQGFANVWSNIKNGFGNVSDWFKNTFSKAWEAVKNVFSSGGKIFDGIKDGILNGLKAVINGLITGINKVISVPFNGLNSALKTIKGISIAGVKPFDWIKTISVPQIPKLAKGGIVDSATLALIGERGPEAVVPLENNTGWMDKLVEKLSARDGVPTKIVLNLDGKELGWANINSINKITRQTGSLQLVLA